MTDRITYNDAETAKDYGPIDGIFIPNCAAYMEQMDTNCFMLILSRGDEELHIWIGKEGKRVEAKVTYREGFEGIEG